MLDIKKIRQDFPILHQQINGKPLVYFDNAATTQKPQCVIDATAQYYSQDNANVHRGVHTLSSRATQTYENAIVLLQKFIGAQTTKEIIFTKGTTESINLVAHSWGRQFLQTGDEILISQLEHHSNIVPWQIVAKERGCHIKVIPINDQGEILLDDYTKLLSEKTKIVAVNHISNALGTINPIANMISMAHQVGALFLFDGSQTPHTFIINF